MWIKVLSPKIIFLVVLLIAIMLSLYHVVTVRCGVSATPYMDVKEDSTHHKFINMMAIPHNGPAVVSGYDANMEAAAQGVYR